MIGATIAVLLVILLGFAFPQMSWLLRFGSSFCIGFFCTFLSHQLHDRGWL
jgi:hypothetical protein